MSASDIAALVAACPISCADVSCPPPPPVASPPPPPLPAASPPPPPVQPRCTDDPSFTDGAGYSCVDWTGWACGGGSTVVAACPVACTDGAPVCPPSPPPPPPPVCCENTCYSGKGTGDGRCEDGGPGSTGSQCDFGTDCSVRAHNCDASNRRLEPPPAACLIRWADADVGGRTAAPAAFRRAAGATPAGAARTLAFSLAKGMALLAALATAFARTVDQAARINIANSAPTAPCAAVRDLGPPSRHAASLSCALARSLVCTSGG